MGQWAASRPCSWECSPEDNLAGFCTFCWHSRILWCFWPGWSRGFKRHRYALSLAFPFLQTVPCICQLHGELFQHSSPPPFSHGKPPLWSWELFYPLSAALANPLLLAPPAHCFDLSWTSRVLLDCTSAQLDCKRALGRGIDDTRVAPTLIRCSIVFGSFHAEGIELV